MNLDTAAPLYVSKDCLNHHDYLLNKILDTAEIRFLTKDSMVFNSAEEINGLYVVLNGTLESFFYENGNYYTNKILKQGAIVGTSRFLTGGRHTGLKCRTDAIVAYVSHDVLIRWDKQALLQLLSTQSQKNQHLINQITTLSLCSCTKRLLLFLYEMAKDNLTMGRMDIPVQISISNKDIASIINTYREHVTKMLRSLEKTMRIKASGNKIVYYPVDVDKKLPVFQALPIKHKCITAQPLIERVNLEPYLDGVELVVAGGESDRDARPLDYEWVLDIREQCIRKQVNFEFRQCGTHFIKDGRQYKLQTRDLCRQARLAGINYQCEPSRDNKRESSYA